MPSTLEVEELSKTRANGGFNEDSEKIAAVDFSSSQVKLNSMKNIGSKIKDETKKLIRYPGKALKRSVVEENNEKTPEDFGPFFRELDILMEFKHLCKDPPKGVYVIPSVKSIQVWHGIIFLRAGLFHKGVFRFDVLLPDTFPNSAPLVRFTSHVYHPQIQANGVLNLEQAFPCWRRGEHHVSDVLKYLKSCFYDPDTCDDLNHEAATTNDDSDTFKAKARECVEESLRKFQEDDVVTSDDDGNLLKIQSFSETFLSEWKHKLLCERKL